MAKIAWHTDIVVDGQGMNVKITRPKKTGCARVVLMPDVPGPRAKEAAARFMKEVNARGSACSTSALKLAVGRAVRSTGARWNRWHHETY